MSKPKDDLLPSIEQGLTPDVFRKETGLWSLDEAVRDKTRGMPMRTHIELYGKTHTGKSTLANYLAGIPNPEGRIAIVDTENAINPDYLIISTAQSGFHGKIKIIDYAVEKKGKREPRYHGEMAQEAMHGLLYDYDAIILDSVGGWMPEAELEGDIGDANMGRRARDITQYARGVSNNLKIAEEPKLAIAVNHVLQSLSHQGTYTPGGRGLSHHAGVRLYVWRNETFEDGSFQSKIKVEKLRWGGTHKEAIAQVVIVPGLGIARGLTAMFDCINLGLAKRPKGGWIKYKAVKAGEVQWHNAGRISELIEQEKAGEMKKLNYFIKLLKEYEDERKAV